MYEIIITILDKSQGKKHEKFDKILYPQKYRSNTLLKVDSLEAATNIATKVTATIRNFEAEES